MVRWIKTTHAVAGIDVKLFTPHPTRSAANNKAKVHVPIETILMHTFAKHYDKPISKEIEFAKSILNYAN